jgi:hypothetical protein
MDIRFPVLFCLIAGLIFACSPIYTCGPNPNPLSVSELTQIKQDMESESDKPRAFLGVAYRAIKTDSFDKIEVSHGYLVDKVVSGSAADNTGLLAGDIILEFDGITLGLVEEEDRKRYLSYYVRHKKNIGDRFCLKILRRTSKIKAKGPGETVYLKNKKELERLIDEQPADNKLLFTIDNKIQILSFDVLLGERKNVAEEDLPGNEDLFPEYEKLTTPHNALMDRLIDHYGLQMQYQDIIARYGEDELWDDGFRLNLFRYLHRDPFKFIPVVEEKTSQLEAMSEGGKLDELLHEAAGLLDVPLAFEKKNALLHGDGQQYLNYILETVNTAWELQQKAFEQLNEQEAKYLREQLVLLFNRFSHSYYIDRPGDPEDKIHNEKIIELAQRVDFSSLFHSALTLAELADPQWLAGLQDSLLTGDQASASTVAGVSGDILYTLSSRAGTVIIGGTGKNIYKTSSAVIIDLGGDDLYTGEAGLVNGRQQIAAIIDLHGNDEYLATDLFSQGSGMLGVGLLSDLSGDDLYVGTRFSQGSAVLGIGMLKDFAGNDRYFGEEFNQGVAFWGAGMLHDAMGNDYYQANLYAQGVGGVKAVGALFDNTGDDFYFAGGRDKSSYGTPGIFKGSSQGLGIGFRGYASGGIGLLLDGNGDDSFWAGNFSQGTGYFFGMGILRNFGAGDDTYTASRYGQGASAHSAAGILIDDSGNDLYNGYHMALQGAAWDMGMAALVDKMGNDTYQGVNGFSQAASAHNGMAFFIDAAGTDEYFGEQALVENNDYHGGSSLSFFIDGGGEFDTYSSGSNNSVTIKGEHGIRADLQGTVESAAKDEYYLK